MENLKEKMNEVLAGFNISAECIKAQQYKHLAFFDVRLDNGTKIKNIENISREMALAMKARKEPLVNSVTSEGVLRIQMALNDTPKLDFHELYKTTTAPEGLLQFLIGETDVGKPLWLDISKNPHMLVAGTTGSGKSTLLHVLIQNAIKRNDVDLYLVDPKHGVEFGSYEDKAIGFASTYIDTITMLKRIHKIMEKRFELMKIAGIKSISECPTIFNKVLVIIDEVADIMQQDNSKENKNQFQNILVSLAQKARATGIYLVAATQRPSVDILNGVIKASFPARIACQVSSSTDSRVILDENGAEALLGRGDAILNCLQYNKVRFQIAYVES